MNLLDIFICVPLFFAAYKGFVRGFIIEVASLIALIAGIYGGVHFSNIASQYIVKYLDVSGSVLTLCSFIATFAAIVIGIILLAKMLEKLVNLVALKFANKLAGVLFGLVKMGLIVSVVLLIVSSVDEHLNFIPSKTKNESLLYKPFTSMSGYLVPTLKKMNWYPNDIKKENLIPEVSPKELLVTD